MNIFDAAARLFRSLHLTEKKGLLDPNGPPVMLVGRKSLDDLAERYGDDIVYRGSRNYIPSLEPRQMNWHDPATGRIFPDGDPAIGADIGYDIPTFMALFIGRRFCRYTANANGGVDYIVGKATTPEAQDLKSLEGYVHVLERKHFTTYIGNIPDGFPNVHSIVRVPELRAYTAVKPLAAVKVTIDDFPHPITFE